MDNKTATEKNCEILLNLSILSLSKSVLHGIT